MSFIKEKCELPLTAEKCVSLIITDIAVIKVTDDGLLLTEVFDDVEVDEVIEKTGAKLKVADNIRRIKYDD